MDFLGVAIKVVDPSKVLELFINGCAGESILYLIWLLVSTHLKNISQNGNLPQVGVKINNVRNHHLVMYLKAMPTSIP